MTTQTNNQTENQNEKSVLESLHASICDLDISNDQAVIFIAVEPVGNGESRLIASLQGAPSILTTAIYKAMTADKDLAHMIEMATLKNFMESIKNEE